MSEILPEDIFRYLERFIKPKKYTLLNKFCRDVYFRKNKIRIGVHETYPDWDIFDKYEIKLIDKSGDFWRVVTKKQDKISKNVTAIKLSDVISQKTYIMACDIFSNLKKFKCRIRVCHNPSENAELLAKSQIINGVKIIFPMGEKHVLQTFAEAGYKIEADDYKIIGELLSPAVAQNVVGISITQNLALDIGIFENLKYITVSSSVSFDPNQEVVKNHKSLKKIVYLGRLPRITSGNIKIATSGTYMYGNGPEEDEMWEDIKKYHDTVAVSRVQHIDSIAKSEKLSQNPKRLKLAFNNLDFELSHKKIIDLTELFDLIITTNKIEINHYKLNHKIHKIEIEETDIVLVFSINNRKIRLIMEK